MQEKIDKNDQLQENLKKIGGMKCISIIAVVCGALGVLIWGLSQLQCVHFKLALCKTTSPSDNNNRHI